MHDCFSANELITYEALGLCPEGKAGEFIDNGDNTYGGKYVVNPSGGLISKGHPLGATGLAQCSELVWQLRGQANERQVENVRYALQHNLGLGGAVVVTLYSRPSWSSAQLSSSLKPLKAPYVPPATKKKAKGGVFKAEGIFKGLAKALTKDMVAKVGVVYRFDIVGPNGKPKSWLVDLKHGEGSITNETKGGDCIFKMKDADFVKLMSGKLNPQKAFMAGKLKLEGNMMLAQKLSVLMSAKPAM